MKIQAVIPAAGAGRRLNAAVPKPFIELAGKPMIVHTLEHIERVARIASVVLVVPQEHMGDFEKVISEHKLHKVIRIVAGGATRQASVYRGLQVLDHDTEAVLIHDGARPLADAELIDKMLTVGRGETALVLGVPLKPTVKRVDPRGMTVVETIDRKDLWEIQTPQLFNKDALLKAHEDGGGIEATDDAMLVERSGVKVKILEGRYDNIKVTTPEDVTLAEFYLKQRTEAHGSSLRHRV